MRRPSAADTSLDAVAQGGERVVGGRGGGVAHPGRRAVLAEDSREGPGPLAGGRARGGSRERGGHDVDVGVGGGLAEDIERRADRPLVAAVAPRAQSLDRRRLHGRVHAQDAAVLTSWRGDGSASV